MLIASILANYALLPGVDSQAAHSEYQSSLLVVRAARVPLRAPKSMDFSTGSTSEAF